MLYFLVILYVHCTDSAAYDADSSTWQVNKKCIYHHHKTAVDDYSSPKVGETSKLVAKGL